MKRSKRHYSDEQRNAMAERMREIQKRRWEKKAQAASEVQETTSPDLGIESGMVAVAEPDVARPESIPATETPRIVPPEVQAVIESMTPERKAKLEQIQARILATEEGQMALRRAQALKEHQQMERGVVTTITPGDSMPPTRLGSREVNLIVRTDGTMVSMNGPCVCGIPKREWHKICLRQSPQEE